MCNDARNDNENYDSVKKILRTSETKRSENIDKIFSKNESSKSFKVNQKGQCVTKSPLLGRSESKCSGIVDRPVTPLLPVAQNSPSC